MKPACTDGQGGKPPSRQARRAFYEYILTVLLPRMRTAVQQQTGNVSFLPDALFREELFQEVIQGNDSQPDEQDARKGENYIGNKNG